MALTKFDVVKTPEVDDAIVVKADDGKERVFSEIPRVVLNDYFPQRSLSAENRVALIESNIDVFADIMNRKYSRGEWQAVPRYGSTLRRISDITMEDLRSASRLSDARLYMEEKAGFQRRG